MKHLQQHKSDILFWGGLLLITTLLLKPGDPTSPPLPVSDKLIHFAAFAYLGACWLCYRWQRMKNAQQTVAWLTLFRQGLLLGAGYALLTELLQHLIPYRGFELADIAADLSGVVSGLLLATGLLKNRKTDDANETR